MLCFEGDMQKCCCEGCTGVDMCMQDTWETWSQSVRYAELAKRRECVKGFQQQSCRITFSSQHQRILLRCVSSTCTGCIAGVMLQPCSRACMQSQVTAPQSRLPLNFCMLRQSSPQDFVRHQSFGRSQRAPALRSATPVAAATGQQQSLADLQASNKDAESLKLQIAQQAGSRNGTDADEAARHAMPPKVGLSPSTRVIGKA